MFNPNWREKMPRPVNKEPQLTKQERLQQRAKLNEQWKLERKKKRSPASFVDGNCLALCFQFLTDEERFLCCKVCVAWKKQCRTVVAWAASRAHLPLCLNTNWRETRRYWQDIKLLRYMSSVDIVNDKKLLELVHLQKLLDNFVMVRALELSGTIEYSTDSIQFLASMSHLASVTIRDDGLLQLLPTNSLADLVPLAHCLNELSLYRISSAKDWFTLASFKKLKVLTLKECNDDELNNKEKEKENEHKELENFSLSVETLILHSSNLHFVIHRTKNLTRLKALYDKYNATYRAILSTPLLAQRLIEVVLPHSIEESEFLSIIRACTNVKSLEVKSPSPLNAYICQHFMPYLKNLEIFVIDYFNAGPSSLLHLVQLPHLKTLEISRSHNFDLKILDKYLVKHSFKDMQHAVTKQRKSSKVLLIKELEFICESQQYKMT